VHVPDDAPARCPVCDAEYDSVSEHDAGLLVNLLDNERYRRVCFDPVLVDGEARVRFYHHTHGQTTLTDSGETTPVDAHLE
jgi:hypothetical protein